MYQKVETARLLTWKAAWDSDQQQDGRVSASISKLYATETALEVVNEALQIFGGYGYTKMFPIEKLLRDVRLLRIYEGTSEIQRIILADYLLKEYQPSPFRPWRTCRSIGSTIPGDVRRQRSGTVWRCRICGHVHYDETPRMSVRTVFSPRLPLRKVNNLDAEN